MTVVPFPARQRESIAALADAVGETEQTAWENAAVEYLRVLVNGRTSGYVVVSVPALNFALARAERTA